MKTPVTVEMLVSINGGSPISFGEPMDLDVQVEINDGVVSFDQNALNHEFLKLLRELADVVEKAIADD